MKASRVLPILNLLGCLLISGIIVVQWLREIAWNERLGNLRKELAESREQTMAEAKRADSLQSDVDQLKESVEATVAERRKTEEEMGKAIAERDAKTAGIVEEAKTQIETWQKAVSERDAAIGKLNTELRNTRQRLDEAIEKLKKAGAR